jgi:hypothetical protein
LRFFLLLCKNKRRNQQSKVKCKRLNNAYTLKISTDYQPKAGVSLILWKYSAAISPNYRIFFKHQRKYEGRRKQLLDSNKQYEAISKKIGCIDLRTYALSNRTEPGSVVQRSDCFVQP